MVMIQSAVFENLRNVIIMHLKHGERAVIVWGVFLAAGIELLYFFFFTFNALRVFQDNIAVCC